MTETGPRLRRLRRAAPGPRAPSGAPAGGLEARVVDDGDRDVAGGETEGELLVRRGGPEGPRHGFFAGYLKNPEATGRGVARRLVPHGRRRAAAATACSISSTARRTSSGGPARTSPPPRSRRCCQAHQAVAQVAVLAVRRDPRGGGHGLRRADAPAAAPDRRWPRTVRAGARAPGLLQGAGLDALRATLPTTGTQKVQKAQIFPRGEDPARLPGVHRPARAQAARLTSRAAPARGRGRPLRRARLAGLHHEVGAAILGPAAPSCWAQTGRSSP